MFDFLSTLTFNGYLWFLGGVYAASAAVMLLLNAIALSGWQHSYKRRVLPNAVLRWHPSCPHSVNVHGFAVLPPDNQERQNMTLLALFPLANTCVALLLCIAVPLAGLFSCYTLLFFGGRQGYQRWLRSH